MPDESETLPILRSVVVFCDGSGWSRFAAEVPQVARGIFKLGLSSRSTIVVTLLVELSHIGRYGLVTNNKVRRKK